LGLGSATGRFRDYRLPSTVYTVIQKGEGDELVWFILPPTLVALYEAIRIPESLALTPRRRTIMRYIQASCLVLAVAKR
jgi:hypothetical protein